MRQLINMVPGYGDATNSRSNQACTGLNQKKDSDSFVSSDTSTKNELSQVSFIFDFSLTHQLSKTTLPFTAKI